MKLPRSLWIVTVILLAASLACSFGSPQQSTPPPTENPVVQLAAPTQTPLPPTATQPPQPTARPTQPPEPTATQGPLAFFSEDFQGDLSLWEYFSLGPNADAEDSVLIESRDNGLLVTIPVPDLYLYLIYTPYTYQDVQVAMTFTNQGVNSQNVGLICRASDAGWYEFSVGNDGLWYFYVYTPENGYQSPANGGSTRVRMGKQSNTYTMRCSGNLVHLYINGEEVKGSPVKVAAYGLPEGQIGLNVSSLDVTPVKALVEMVEISQP